MIKLEKTEVVGWEAAIRGMRNPMNSWDKSDSHEVTVADYMSSVTPWDLKNTYVIGPNDHELMMKLAKAGTDHRKFMRMIDVYLDITAPLYWWKEFDTYKVGTVANSCSTMHKIHAKQFTMDDFSCEHMYQETYDLFRLLVDHLNNIRDIYLHGGVLRVGEAPAWFEPKDKEIWWQMIQLLPSSYNQRRTVKLNYEVLANIYKSRRGHKLDEWLEFCKWIESLPYSELITGVSLNDLPICNEIMEEAKRRVTNEENKK